MSSPKGNTPAEGSPTNSEQVPQPGFKALQIFILNNRINFAQWVLRIITILFAFAFYIPIFGNARNIYYKILLANAATSALRLHQRVPRFQLNREYLKQLFLEDSCHYLFYSVIFLYVAPISLVLLPVILFSILHSASYSLTLLDTMGQNSWWGARLLISLVEFQSRNILRLVSFSEIMLMPLTIILVFMGKAGLLTPVIYYNFLAQRYASRRNPYTRNMFHELRITLESTAAKPKVPVIIRKMLLGIVSFTSKLAPPQVAAQ